MTIRDIVIGFAGSYTKSKENDYHDKDFTDLPKTRATAYEKKNMEKQRKQ